MFCSQCGNSVEDASFCNQCGTPVSNIEPPEPEPYQESYQEPYQESYQEPQYDPYSEPEPQMVPEVPQTQEVQPFPLSPQQYQDPYQPQQYPQQHAPQQYSQQQQHPHHYQPQQYPQQQYPQQYHHQYPPRYAPQAPMNPIFKDSIDIGKKFFSSDPAESLKVAAGSKSHNWAIIAGVGVLLSALALMLVPGGIMLYFENLGRSMYRVSISDIFSEMPLAAMFGFGLLGSIIMYFLWASCVKVVYAISKVDIPFLTVLNITAVSLLPSAVTCVVAILFGFFFAPASILLVIVGAVANLLLLYHGVNNTGQFQKSPFWLITASYAICTVILYVLITQLSAAVMNLAYGGYGYSIFDFF